MPTRNSKELKKAIFDVLDGSSTLQTLLGGTGRVRYGTPDNSSAYPCVCYYPLTEVGNAINVDQSDVDIVRSVFIIETFASTTTPTVTDDIDDEVYALLHMQRIGDTNNAIFLSQRDTKAQFYDPEVQIQRVQSRYSFYNSSV